MRSLSYDPPFIEFAAVAAEQAGLELKPPEYTPGYYEHIHCTAESTDGQLWVALSKGNAEQAYLAQNSLAPDMMYRDYYAFMGGVLTHDKGLFHVVREDEYRLVPPSQYVIIETFSSPEAINQLQAKLGRNPGKDAFKLTPFNPRFVEPKDYIEGAGQLEIRISTINDDLIEHDLQPVAHVLSWLFTPPEFCQAIGRRANALMEKYGQAAISLPQEERPVEASRFVGALDNLGSIIMPVLRALFKLSSPVANANTYTYRNFSPVVNLFETLRISDRYSSDRELEQDRKFHALRLNNLGILPIAADECLRNSGIEKVNRRIAVFVAETLLRISATSPGGVSDYTKNMWKNVVDKVATRD